MKNRQKMLVFLIVLVILIIILIIITIIYLRNSQIKKELEEEQNVYSYYERNPAQTVNGKKPTRTQSINWYYTVERPVKNFLSMLESKSNEFIISYLDEEYIKEKNISEKNVLEIIDNYNDYSSYRTIEMYELVGKQYISYYVKGNIDKKDIFFDVGIDIGNNTFDLKPITSEEYENFINKEAYTEESKEKIIPNKKYNIVIYQNFQEQDIVRIYFSEYMKLMLKDSELAYKMLDEEYKNMKYGSLKNFNEFVKFNSERIEKSYKCETMDEIEEDYNSEDFIYKLQGYSKIDYDDYTQYICTNQIGTYYIFNEKNPGEYTVLLDSYTKDLPEFIKKYNQATDSNKVTMNAEKMKQALNIGDFRYVYNKLDETFKKNNFDTLEKFKSYMKSNLFEYNKFEYNEVKQNGEIYILGVTITDVTKKLTDEKKCNIIMKLQDDSNFVMSFEVK